MKLLMQAKILQLFLGFVLGDAILFLQLAEEMFLISFSLLQIVVSEFAPLLFDLAGQLLPFAFNGIFVHCYYSCVGELIAGNADNKCRCVNASYAFDLLSEIGGVIDRSLRINGARQRNDMVNGLHADLEALGHAVSQQ